MKNLIIALLPLCLNLSLNAQKTFKESINPNGANSIAIKTEYANVSVQTWDKNEVQVKGRIDIFDNTYNDNFTWLHRNDRGILKIESEVEEPKGGFSQWRRNSDDDCCKTKQMRIELTIMMPENMAIKMRGKYGSIALENVQRDLDILNTYGSIDVVFNQLPKGSLHLESTYSHVDLSLPKDSKASFTLKTPYGEVLTDMPLEVKGSDRPAKSTIIAHLNGGGKEIYAESGYNTIYLRETK
ncbi:MAG: DUF4097 family beta strand repeat-containing protein [Bacteroidota bacterium]